MRKLIFTFYMTKKGADQPTHMIDTIVVFSPVSRWAILANSNCGDSEKSVSEVDEHVLGFK